MQFGTAIVLAGGKSARMGFDKQTIMKNDQRLVDETIRRLRRVFSDIIVVTKTPEYYTHLDVTTTQDVLPSTGPLAGIHAGLLQSKADYAFVLACDMPYFNPDYARFMEQHMRPEDTGILTALDDGWIEPFHAYYGKALIRPIEDYLSQGKRNIRDLAWDNGVQFLPEKHILSMDPDKRLFQNLNTPEDLEIFLQIDR